MGLSIIINPALLIYVQLTLILDFVEANSVMSDVDIKVVNSRMKSFENLFRKTINGRAVKNGKLIITIESIFENCSLF